MDQNMFSVVHAGAFKPGASILNMRAFSRFPVNMLAETIPILFDMIGALTHRRIALLPDNKI